MNDTGAGGPPVTAGVGSPLASAVFAALVLATFAAFFVTQRLKHAPTVVQRIQLTPVFSPTGHTGLHREVISFRISKADEVTVTVVDTAGDDIATLARSRYLPAYAQQSLRWAGVDDDGRPAPDGVYRVRFRLRNQGRTIEAPRSFRLKSTAPRPSVTVSAAGVPGSGPLILPLPGATHVQISLDLGGGSSPSLELYQTDVTPARPVLALPVAPGARSVTWDGTDHGRPLPDAVYAVTITDTDAAGNVGSSPPALPPRAVAGATISGRAGVTVRHVAIQPPLGPVASGSSVSFGVDSRRAPYSWSVARLGQSRVRSRGRGRGPLLRVRAPAGVSGVYVLTVAAAGHSAAVPFEVQGRSSSPVLVVVPAITWLGRDLVDDDGDGLPDTLEGGRPVLRSRVLASLPTGVASAIAPALAFLDRHRLRYDVTTDLALDGAAGPVELTAHRGVLLVGDERWLTLGVQASLKRFVVAGGHLASFGVQSLRRTVSATASALTEPGPPAPADVYGARIGPLVRGPVRVVNLEDGLGLFTGGTGLFANVGAYEPTLEIGPSATLGSRAVSPAGQGVIVAVRYGRGVVVRTGIQGFGARLAGDANSAALMERVWALLSR